MTATQSHRLRALRVGQDVQIDMGTYVANGVLVEDRGPFGVGGERVWRVRVPVTDSDDLDFEVPETRIAPVKR